MTFTTLELTLAILAAEFALAAVVFATLLWRRGRQQQAAAVASVDALVSSVTQAEAPRRDALLALLRETYRFDGEESARVVSDFIEREQAFYNMLIGVHLGRGGKTLADVPAELTRLVAPWLSLTPRGTADEAAVADLESRNSALSAELDETKRVLDDLMDEYSAAFLRGGDAASAPNFDPAPETAMPEEEPLARTAGSLREVSGDQLLSMDDFDIPRAGASEAPAPDAVGAVDFDPEVIDLTAAPDEPLPMSSEDDLDTLMQNIGLEPGGPAARGETA